MTNAEFRRLEYLPVAIENTRRKLAALEREALRHGLRDLVTPSSHERPN